MLKIIAYVFSTVCGIFQLTAGTLAIVRGDAPISELAILLIIGGIIMIIVTQYINPYIK